MNGNIILITIGASIAVVTLCVVSYLWGYLAGNKSNRK